MNAIQYIFILLFSTQFFVSNGQYLSRSNLKKLQMQEDTMKGYSHDMIFKELAPQRFDAMSKFTPLLVQSLKTPYSFHYHFDSLETISIIYPPDSSFRIFTWELERDESYYRQYGAIQVNTKDGSLKLFPLIDASDFATNPVDSIRTPANWIGAIYYGIVMKVYRSKKILYPSRL